MFLRAAYILKPIKRERSLGFFDSAQLHEDAVVLREVEAVDYGVSGLYNATPVH